MMNSSDVKLRTAVIWLLTVSNHWTIIQCVSNSTGELFNAACFRMTVKLNYSLLLKTYLIVLISEHKWSRGFQDCGYLSHSEKVKVPIYEITGNLEIIRVISAIFRRFHSN